MKKYGLLIIVLVASIFSSMVSESAAIYTHSDFYNLTFKFIKYPIINGDFLKYEIAGERRCDYNKATINDVAPGNGERKCEQGSAEYNENTNTINLFQDAGFFKNYKDSDVAYLVNGSFTYDHTNPPKNFGMYFNGSYVQNNNGTKAGEMLSNGYVLLFDNAGNLVINEQGIVNLQDLSKHEHDSTRTSSEKPDRNLPVASKDEVEKILNGTSSIYLQVRVRSVDGDKLVTYVYINGINIGKPIELHQDLRGFYYGGRLQENQMIGASTYGLGANVIVTHLNKEVWDGKTL